MDEQERLISTSCQENPSSYQFLCQHLQWLLLLREFDPTISSSYPYVFSNYAANIQHKIAHLLCTTDKIDLTIGRQDSLKDETLSIV